MFFQPEKLLPDEGIVAWEYYFSLLKDVHRGAIKDRAMAMNAFLAANGVFCDRRPGAFGLMIHDMNASSVHWLLSFRYYFSSKKCAQRFLAAAIVAGFAEKFWDFIFEICQPQTEGENGNTDTKEKT